MPNLIPQEDFEKMTDDVKLNILFSYVSDLYQINRSEIANQIKICREHWESCHERFSKMERRKRIDTTFSGIMGIVGGGVVTGVKWLAGK